MKIKYKTNPWSIQDVIEGKVRIKVNNPNQAKEVIFKLRDLINNPITETQYVMEYHFSNDPYSLIGVRNKTRVIWMDKDCWDNEYINLPIVNINNIKI